MDNKMPMEIEQLDSKLQPENAADMIGICFAAAVLCAVLVAGMIVYRGGNSDVVTAANEPIPAAVHSAPLSPPILPQR